MKRLLIALFIGVLAVANVGCSSEESSTQTEATNTVATKTGDPTSSKGSSGNDNNGTKSPKPTKKPILDPDQCFKYANDRFEYSILYPKDWRASGEMASADGVSLYNKDGNSIRTYGSMDFGFQKNFVKEQQGLGRKVTQMKNNAGKPGNLITGTINGKRLFNYTVIQDNKACQLYATLTDEFYQSNEKLITEIAKTLQFE